MAYSITFNKLNSSQIKSNNNDKKTFFKAPDAVAGKSYMKY